LKTKVKHSTSRESMASKPKTSLKQVNRPQTLQTQQQQQRQQQQPKTDNVDNGNKLTTIRVKTEDGLSSFDFKMKYSETIGDLRSAIDRKRPQCTSVYDVMTNFPKRTFEDHKKSLLECGLVPNAAILLKPRFA